MEVVELGVSGTKSVGKPGEPIKMKDEKELKPASMRVRDSADALLTVILEQVHRSSYNLRMLCFVILLYKNYAINRLAISLVPVEHNPCRLYWMKCRFFGIATVGPVAEFHVKQQSRDFDISLLRMPR